MFRPLNEFDLHLKKAMLLISCVFLLSGIFTVSIHAQRIGARVGIVSPGSSYNSTIFYAAVFDLGVDTFLENIAPELEFPSLKGESSIEYWSTNAGEGLFLNEVTLSTLAFNSTVKYYFPISGKISPFAGVGLGSIISLFDFAGESNIVGLSSSSFDVGLHGVGGVDIPIGSKLTLRTQAKYSIGGVDNFQIGASILFGSPRASISDSTVVPVNYQSQGILKNRYPKLNVRLLEIQDARHELEKSRTAIENYEVLNDALKQELTDVGIKVIYGKENGTPTLGLDIVTSLNYLATYKSMGGKNKIVHLITDVKVQDSQTGEVLFHKKVTAKKYGKEVSKLYQDTIQDFVLNLLESDEMQNVLAKYR